MRNFTESSVTEVSWWAMELAVYSQSPLAACWMWYYCDGIHEGIQRDSYGLFGIFYQECAHDFVYSNYYIFSLVYEFYLGNRIIRHPLREPSFPVLFS